MCSYILNKLFAKECLRLDLEKMNKVTLKDIAAEVGVSEMTASRAMRKHSDVSQKTQERVMQAAKELGYIPNKVASMLASRTSQIIPMIVPSLRNSVFLDVIAAAQELINAKGYQMMLLNTQYSVDKETDAVEALMAWSPAALILSGVNHSEATSNLLAEVNFPVIEIMDTDDKAIDICVGFSHHMAGKAMGEYLLKQGYRSFAFCGSRLEEDIRGKKRYEGFRTAIINAGLEAPNMINLTARFGDLVESNAFEEIIAKIWNLDCIYFANDDLAVGVLLTCQRMGLNVPKDLAVAGFNDLHTGMLIQPRLTTSRSPRREIGAIAARCALDRIEGKELDQKKIELECKLVARESA